MSFDDQIEQLKRQFEPDNTPIKITIALVNSYENSCTASGDSYEDLTDRSTDFSGEDSGNSSAVSNEVLSNILIDNLENYSRIFPINFDKGIRDISRKVSDGDMKSLVDKFIKPPYTSSQTEAGSNSLPIEYLYQKEELAASASTKIKSNVLKYLSRGKHIFSNQKKDDYFWHDKETGFYYNVDIYNVLLDNEDVYFDVNTFQSYLRVTGSSFFYKVNCDEPHLQYLNRSPSCSVSADENTIYNATNGKYH